MSEPIRTVPTFPRPQDPTPKRWSGSCRARCAHTGKRCELPAHTELPHRHGRTAFIAVAYEGQEHFAGDQELVAAAYSRGEGLIPEGDRATGLRNQDVNRENQRRHYEKKKAERAAAIAQQLAGIRTGGAS